ncbi:N-acetylneuraminate synthase family protein [Agrobacterium sp. ES01]|uniref:N-acetylneuraminate synthase family protein n=1 Tax=Agrobacterium sp. ES01 TaxID=3420714 RepID=UPI003D0DD5DB
MVSFSRQISDIASIYATDTIFILGKGPSAGEIPPSIFDGSLVIGVNDAERIQPTDISIFHADWVKAALEASGPKAQLYLTSTDYRPTEGKVIRVPHESLGQESGDLMMQRLLSGPLVIEDVLFISALKVCLEVAKVRERAQKVYMIGFDFTPEAGYAEMAGGHFETGDIQDRRLVIGMQENFLLNALYMLQGSQIDVIHVGNRNYSAASVADIVERDFPTARAQASSQSKVAVVAELTTNHFGDRDRLERMVRTAKAAGADYVKVQKRDVATFYSTAQLSAPYRSPFGQTFGDYRRKLELTADDFDFLDTLCRKLKIDWFASILDEASFNFIRDFNPALIKLPSTISEHTDYLAKVARVADRGIVLSTGMTDKNFESWILETFKDVPTLYLMQANSAYPTPARDCNIAVVRHYHTLSTTNQHIVPAYSSHDEGSIGSMLAVAAGARMVEKHVKLGNSEWAHFDAVALDMTSSDFCNYVNKIREAEIMIGSEVKTVAPSEHHKYRKAP